MITQQQNNCIHTSAANVFDIQIRGCPKVICSEQILSAPTEVGSAVSKSACECLTAAAIRRVPVALCFAANVCNRLEAIAEFLAGVVTALQKPFVYVTSGLRNWQTRRLQFT